MPLVRLVSILSTYSLGQRELPTEWGFPTADALVASLEHVGCDQWHPTDSDFED